ncbi:arginine deiminase family protein [Staphylococcus aureus]|uniref:arginine deiminase family protein n=1 Tax=Staphylococcus aureus TaxID=1280 RepID=UPI0037DA0443
MHAPRHQSNHPSNTLCIRPPLVLTYHTNYLSNHLFTQKPIKLIQISPTHFLPPPPPPTSITQPLFTQHI